MATRWEVEEQVLASSIEPGGRHILLTLLSRSTAATAEIPSKHVPTFDDLECMTGLARSTLIEWMKTLSDSNWICREVFDGETRPGMRVMIGDLKAERTKRVRKSKKPDALYRVAVQTDGSGVVTDIPPRGTPHTATRYEDIPPRGMDEEGHLLKDSPTESLNHADRDQSAASADDTSGGTLDVDFGEPVEPVIAKPGKRARKKKAPPEETEKNKQLYRVTKIYTDRVMSNWHKSREVVRTAFNYNFTEQQITAGLNKLVKTKDPLTIDSLRIAIQGSPSWAAARNGGGYTSRNGTNPGDYRNPDDPSVYDSEWEELKQ